jgi:hypothetical protein
MLAVNRALQGLESRSGFGRWVHYRHEALGAYSTHSPRAYF